MPEDIPRLTTPREVLRHSESTLKNVDDRFREILDLFSKNSGREHVKVIYTQYHYHFTTLTTELKNELTSSEFIISLTIKYLIATQDCLKEMMEFSDENSAEKINRLISHTEISLSDFARIKDIIRNENGEKISSSIKELMSEIESMRTHQRSYISSIEKNNDRLYELEQKINRITIENGNLEKLVKEQSTMIEDQFYDSIKYLDEKKKEVEDVVGLIAEKSVAGSYEISASEERSNANWLRGIAITFMIMIVVVIGYTLVESVTPKFSIEIAALRISFALILSIPAAYLARESAKHRQQQYTHLQTSLDLKAITPYIASLPTDTQNKLKEEMASRIFSQKNFEHITKETYPINTHEIVMALIDKFQPKDKKDDSTAE